MKTWLLATLTGLTLTACSSTWQGLKQDSQHNAARVESGAEAAWDKTKDVAKQSGQAVGKGLSKAGEKIESISQ